MQPPTKRKLTPRLHLCIIACLCLAIKLCRGFGLYDKVTTSSDFVAYRMAQGLQGARTVLIDQDSGDLLVLARGQLAKVVLVRVNGDNVTTFPLLSTGINLNHGLDIHQGYLYASDSTTVYRWRYTSGSTTPLDANASEVVVKNMNANGRGGAPQGHTTRTIAISNTSRMFVSVGSEGNLDDNSFRARIRSFDLTKPIPAGGWEFLDESNLFADGLRNQVALGFDLQGRLWGCETGIDNVERPDLNLGSLYNDNPAEELHLFDGPPGQRFGYPYCFSSFLLGSYPACTQFAVQGRQTDEWCRNATNNRAPELCMPAHVSPLGITFYTGEGCENAGAMPCAWTGDAFVAMHGSWNRVVPNGFQVVRIPMGGPSALPLGTWSTLAEQVNYTTACIGNQAAACWRPVDVAFLNDGRLVITTDTLGDLTVLEYVGVPVSNPIGPPPPRPPALPVQTPQPAMPAPPSPPSTLTPSTAPPAAVPGLAAWVVVLGVSALMAGMGV